MLQRIRIILSGRVQGIFFRYFIQEHAKKLQLTGYVQNRQDGKLEAVFEGQKEKIQEMIDICKRGPPLAKVDNITINEEKPTKEFADFTVRRQ